MVRLEEVTIIRAPIGRCFDLSRSIELHMRSTVRTGEVAVAGVTSGLIGLGAEVTWRARHFGVTQTMTVRITAFDSPHHFQDRMVRGAFRFFKHDHWFVERDGMTEMRDVLRFAAPFWILGVLVEPLLRGYLRRFLRERNSVIREMAEGDGWRDFLAGR
ncbi:MAG: SRPBCC family protein [Acidobacteriaceae bacterium]